MSKIYMLNAVLAIGCFVSILAVDNTQLQILLATASVFNQIAVVKHEIVTDITTEE